MDLLNWDMALQTIREGYDRKTGWDPKFGQWVEWQVLDCPDRLCVMRSTERVLVPKRDAQLGNFGTVNVSRS